MIACARTMSPPPPRPCSVRKAMSSPMPWRLPAQHRADEEDDDRRLEDALAAVEVAELAVDRRRDRRGQQVAGDDPGELIEAAELGGDRRQRGGDDRPVERRQQDRQHERREDEQDLAARTRRRSRQSGRRSGHVGQLRASAPATRDRASPRRRPRPRARPREAEDRSGQLALALPELLLAPVDLLLEDRLRRVERQRAVDRDRRRELERGVDRPAALGQAVDEAELVARARP